MRHSWLTVISPSWTDSSYEIIKLCLIISSYHHQSRTSSHLSPWNRTKLTGKTCQCDGVLEQCHLPGCNIITPPHPSRILYVLSSLKCGGECSTNCRYLGLTIIKISVSTQVMINIILFYQRKQPSLACCNLFQQYNNGWNIQPQYMNVIQQQLFV